MNKRKFLILILLILFLISWNGFFIFSSLNNNGALENQVKKHLESIAVSKAERVGNFLAERKNDLEFLVEMDGVADSFEDGVVDFDLAKKLNSFRDVNGYLDLIFIDINGVVLFGENKGENLVNTNSELGRVYGKVKKDFGVGIFDPGYFKEGEMLSVYVTSPVLIDSVSVSEKRDMVGIVVLRIDNAEIEKRVESDVGLEKGWVYLVNRDSVPVVSLLDENGRQVVRDDSEIVKDCFKDYRNYYFARSGDEVVPVDKSGVYDDYIGRRVFGAHAYILRTGWCVVVEKMEGLI